MSHGIQSALFARRESPVPAHSSRWEAPIMERRRHLLRTALTCGMALACAGAAPQLAPSRAQESPEIMIYAAASLRDVLQGLAPLCEEGTGVRLAFNFGASNDLARQI